MNIKFQLIESKQDSNGLCPVFLRYFYSGSDLRYFTGEKCKLTDWDSDKMKFKRSHEGWQNANERLSKLRSDLESAAHNFKLQRIIPTPQQLKDSISPQSVKKEIVISLSLVDVYDDFYKHSENEGKKLSALKSLKLLAIIYPNFVLLTPTLVNNFTDRVYTWKVSNFEYQRPSHVRYAIIEP